MSRLIKHNLFIIPDMQSLVQVENENNDRLNHWYVWLSYSPDTIDGCVSYDRGSLSLISVECIIPKTFFLSATELHKNYTFESNSFTI